MRRFHGDGGGIARDFINNPDPRDVLGAYRRAVRKTRSYSARLREPVNQNTGEPLKAATLAQYRSAYKCWHHRMEELKGTIRYMVEQGFLGYTRVRKDMLRLQRDIERKDAMIASQADVIRSLRESIQSQRRHIRTLVARIERLQQGLAEPPKPVKKGNVIYLKRPGVTMRR
jgi:chromosome segregation ATPase